MTIPIRGTAALIVAAAIVAITAIGLPAYRWFLVISVGVAVIFRRPASLAQTPPGQRRRYRK